MCCIIKVVYIVMYTTLIFYILRIGGFIMNIKIGIKIAETRIDKEYDTEISLKEISLDFNTAYASPIVAAKVNNVIKDIQTVIHEDCEIEFIEMNTEFGIKVYQRSVTFLLIAAVHELYTKGEVTVEHSVSNGLFCEVHLGRALLDADVKAIECKMREIVLEERTIMKKALPKDKCLELFNKSGQFEKANLIAHLERDTVSVYFCGKIYDYLYGPILSNTGEIHLFGLTHYKSGLIIRIPEIGNVDTVPKFVEQEKLANIFAEAEQWAEILQCDYVEKLNTYTKRGHIDEIIRISEALHEKKIAQIADFIVNHTNQARIILIAGPSSSGKTTFAQRLRVQLRVNGVIPVAISLDDYFLNRAYTPRDEKGDYDFEALEALDIELFNQQLIDLLNGKAVEIPYYNFLTGEREYRGNIVQISESQPIIIEGIHGLNERLTSKIPRDKKLKIYISALTQLAIDGHNRIPTTDARLIRRIVRDYKFRGSTALKTLKQWQSVRNGEEKNIFPFQEEADIMFNSALIYELGILKKHAEPLLKEVKNTEYEHAEATRLLNFLEYFISIEDDNEVPVNSILKEFIGKSCFVK